MSLRRTFCKHQYTKIPKNCDFPTSAFKFLWITESKDKIQLSCGVKRSCCSKVQLALNSRVQCTFVHYGLVEQCISKQAQLSSKGENDGVSE